MKVGKEVKEKNKPRSIYAIQAKSTGAKSVLLSLNALGVAFGAWVLFGGLDTIIGLFGAPAIDVDSMRRVLIVACSALYLIRVVGTTFIIAKRQITFGEAIGVGIWIFFIHSTMATLGGLNADTVGWLTWIGVMLYLIGSVLNTGSEYLRKRWKADPAHDGQLYTGGLFRFAVHINYFGDTVLFTGFALIVGNVWAFVIPGLMAILFVFVNIPMLDKHLTEHYGQPFTDYAKRTAKFVPFLY